MKPIMLEIKGFQSFRDIQTIAFETLTSKGLFGIFGSTGSGKSTILDAIMYALYGKVSREQQNEFINVNEREAFVRYTFELKSGTGRRRFIVKRSVRKNASDKYQTPNVVLSEVVVRDGEETIEVIGEKVREVNELIENLIGLKMDDFTRAVVLPQGKFSEFLKIDPSKRNEMLERIFGLEKYGRQLTDKMKKKAADNRKELEKKEEVIATYGDISQEKLTQLIDEKKILQEQKQVIVEKQKQVATQYEEGKEVRGLIEELEHNKKREELLLLQEEKIRLVEGEMKRATKAAEIMPLIDNANEVEEQLAELSNSLIEEENIQKKHRTCLDDQEKEYKKAIAEKEKKMPDLLVKKNELTIVKKDTIQLQQLNQQLIGKKMQWKQQQEERNNLQHEIELKESEQKKITSQLEEKKQLLQTLIVSSETRKQIQTGNSLEKEIQKANLQLVEEKNAIEKKRVAILLDTQEVDALTTILQEKITTFEAEKQQLLHYEKQPQWSDEDFQDFNQRIFAKENEMKQLEDNLEENEQVQVALMKIEKELETFQNEMMMLRDEEGSVAAQLQDIVEKIEQWKVHNLAATLAQNLHEDDPCPVCGNTHKIKLAEQQDQTLLTSYEKEHQQLATSLEKIRKRCTEITIYLSTKTAKEKELKEQYALLHNQICVLSVEELKKDIEKLKVQTNQALQNKKEVEDKIKYYLKTTQVLERERLELESKINQIKMRIEVEEKDLKQRMEKTATLEAQYEDLQKEFAPLQSLYKNQMFSQLSLDITAKDEQREKVDKEYQVLEQQLKDILSQLDQDKNILVQMNETLKTCEDEQKDLEGKINELLLKIETICGTKEPNAYYDEIVAQLEQLTKRVEEKQMELQKIQDLLEASNNTVVSLRSTKQAQQVQLEKERKRIERLLVQNEFENEEQVIIDYRDEQTRQKMMEQVQVYTTELLKVHTLIRTIHEKLNNRSITEEAWVALVDEKETINKEIDTLTKQIASLESIIIRMKQDLDRVGELVNEITILRQQQNRLDELNKVMRGNSFIEYISSGQLKYIALEASKRLMEITKGKYSLLLDDATHKFLIRDHTSGGYTRSTDSLSGGELFLTSLSLALALSSHIQLKNSAPLEFFFLDEGFGTLDEHILDTAMSSLEKLHSNVMSVGIISHVKEIQERIPVKLLVTAASSGEGSKVKLEYS
ncbi:MAG: AAA family ATPase [Bacillaceae bacterium]